MCGRPGCGDTILFHVLGWEERDSHCIRAGCGCPAYVKEEP